MFNRALRLIGQLLLSASLTVRKNLIRVISARDMSRKERRVYESAEENT
ncbi:MAG: BrnT family toxin [Candidatus Electrothrix sp. EH2]|nr:BrnT family toxin [Candidatus Electrothrix sp. EH2]